MAGRSRASRVAQVVALLVCAAAGMWAISAAGTASAADKVWVCKYVGQPGVDETLKGGENPIEVSVNAAGPPGSLFNDAQGRSYVIAYSDGGPAPECPETPPIGPTESPTCLPTESPTTELSPTQEPTPEESTDTAVPTTEPTSEPTTGPTTEPTSEPTSESTPPTEEPGATETGCPTGNCPPEVPSGSPTASPAPGPTESTPTESPSVEATGSTAPGETGTSTACASGQASDAVAGESEGAGSSGGSGASPGASSPGGTVGGTGDNAGPTGSSAGLATATGTVLARTSAQGVRIIIPTLRVDAPVVGVGAPGGSLQPPLDPSVLGRWTGGATIGAAHGRALVTGHSVHDGDGALDALASLSRGDLVLVRTPYGLQRQVVTQVRVLTKRELVAASSTLFHQDGPGRLVLVTCTGWNGMSYGSNVVVVARPVTSLQLDRLPRRSVAGE